MAVKHAASERGFIIGVSTYINLVKHTAIWLASQ